VEALDTITNLILSRDLLAVVLVAAETVALIL
jgi:hypothetical protein